MSEVPLYMAGGSVVMKVSRLLHMGTVEPS